MRTEPTTEHSRDEEKYPPASPSPSPQVVHVIRDKRASAGPRSGALNLILFESQDATASLPRKDPRAAHVLGVLRRKVGDTFDAGVVNGPRGKGTVIGVTDEQLAVSFAWGSALGPLDPLIVLVGLPRPQTARDVLREATTLGVGALHFVATEKSEASYAQSTLWSSGEWRRHLLDGAQQAFDTRIPEVTSGRTLAEVVSALPFPSVRLALDNYEAAAALNAAAVSSGGPVVLAIGGERGWAEGDRRTLRTNGFRLVHLGARVLRTETAVIAAVTLVRSKLGRL